MTQHVSTENSKIKTDVVKERAGFFEQSLFPMRARRPQPTVTYAQARQHSAGGGERQPAAACTEDQPETLETPVWVPPCCTRGTSGIAKTKKSVTKHDMMIRSFRWLCCVRVSAWPRHKLALHGVVCASSCGKLFVCCVGCGWVLLVCWGNRGCPCRACSGGLG